MALPRSPLVFLCVRYGRRAAPSTSAAAGQPLALHPPDQQLDTILSEERLVLEHESRHAPMAGGRMGLFVVGDDRFIAVGVGGYRGIHRGQVKSGGSGGA